MRPNVFWLTGFFNPQGFLTANRQEVCRKHSKEGWALDDVVNLTKVVNMEKDEVRKGPDEGVYIHGLFLDGCHWDKRGQQACRLYPQDALRAAARAPRYSRACDGQEG